MGWGWIWVVLLVLLILGAVAAVVVLLVKATSSGPSSAPPAQGHGTGAPPSNARAIAEERLARGELSPDQFREIVRALEDGSGRQDG
ncbi:SHOCT domain-containing protein [Agromyces sp. ZXT2-6]|uniref:SHOCT domain-containing protein n=1 Tax=Agromyces sp. ZXT2-6 TaxID=3461153 RepID=UPI004054D612